MNDVLVKGRVPAGHFDMYSGEWFDKVVKMETEFLIKHLKNK